MKNKDVLLDVIGDIDEELVPDILPQKRSIRKYAIVCAGICAVLMVGFILGNRNNNNSISPYGMLQQTLDGEKKTGTEKIKSAVTFGTMGFEGMMAYDISELDTPNPWKFGANISSLPVFRNLAYIEGEDSFMSGLSYLTEEQMRGIIQNTALALDVDVVDIRITYVKDIVQSGISDETMNGIYSMEANCSKKTMIIVYGDGEIKVDFENKSLPSRYNFSYKNTTAKEAEKILEYLGKEYANLLCFGNEVGYSYADRTFSGEEIRSYYIFDKSDDMVESILNFNFNSVRFSPDDDGNLMCIRLNNPYCSAEYIGDYSVISESDAKELLQNGNYYSSVPADYIRSGTILSEDIAKSELVYINERVEYYQPYYKFYVELDSSMFDMADDLKNFGIFYVPAVSSEFLDDFD